MVAQQQCVGPLQLPLADVAVMSQSHIGLTGVAFSIGEQPLKGLINPTSMARLALGESLLNLMWAQITSIQDIKSSVNWMYAAKMYGEGAAMYDAATALRCLTRPAVFLLRNLFCVTCVHIQLLCINASWHHVTFVEFFACDHIGCGCSHCHLCIRPG